MGCGVGDPPNAKTINKKKKKKKKKKKFNEKMFQLIELTFEKSITEYIWFWNG
jgi:hypothetical protein